MYPQINLAGGFTNPTPINTSAGLSGVPSFSSPGSPSDQTTSLLRVVVAEKFRVAPPVPAPPSASAVLPGTSAATTAPGTAPPLNFDYEKQTLRELEAPRSLDSTLTGNNNLRKDERCEALISQCCSSGYNREEAVLALSVALAIAGPRADGAAVAQAAGSIRQMINMGYAKADAVGALVAKNGNLPGAIEMF